MFRQSVVVAALLLALVCPRAFALGLGEIDMRSALNQPMDAVIYLTSASTANLDDIRVSLASLQDHTRAGLSKAAILADFNFTIEKDASGKPIIRVRSDALVREPYLEFLLELDWPRGRLLRQYTVLVDPPVTMPATPAVPAAPVSRPATPAPATRAPATPAPLKRPVAAPATVSVARQPAPNSYGPVRRSETLWSIANRLRPDEGVSIEQMMLALQRANPRAFEGNNINRLLEGVTLTVPTRDEVLSMSRREAAAESRRQFAEWQAGRAQTTTAAAPAPQATTDADPSDTSSTAAPPAAQAAVDTGSRLQLTAPEADAVSGAAMPGDPLTAAAGESQDIQQRLALAAEEVAAERAQSQELQSRVGELEEQVTTMKRLLELKDDELARLQQNIATDDLQADTAMDQTAGADAVAGSGSVAEMEQGPVDEAVSVEPTPIDTATAADQGLLDRLTGLVSPLLDRLSGLVRKLMDNPMFAGLGVVVVLVLGGIVWAMRRFRSGEDTLDDEFTMERQLAGVAGHEPVMPVHEVAVDDQVIDDSEPESTVAHDIESDPVTEADVYLAYGRIQQAEDVLLAALQSRPDNVEARMKLLEVYHSGGNAAAFDQAAAAYHEMFGADDRHWEKVAAMGLSLSPHNALYGGGGPAAEEGTDLDMDLSGLEQASPQSEPAGADKQESNTIEFTLDTVASDEEDVSEGLLENVDEMTTKLDLARAYIDMDDSDSARSILGEVIEEGNAEQKEEAESIISKLA